MLRKLSQMLSDKASRGHRRPRGSRPSIERLEDRAVPATISVTTRLDLVNRFDGVTSLREAISIANNLPGPDIIRLQQAGVYRITRLGADDSNFRGDFDVTGPLTIAGLDAGGSVIAGSLAGVRERLFDVHGQVNVTFNNLVLRDGGNSQSDGGAVHALKANVTLRGVIVTGCKALKGGAINAEDGNVQLIRTRMSGNTSAGVGGSINATNGRVVMTDSTVGFSTAGGSGGGVAAKNVDMFTSRVSGNTAGGDGGGLYVFGGTAGLRDSTVSNNFAAGGGGGIAATTAGLNRSTVSGNRCQLFGGGLSALRANLFNSTVSNNQAGTHSGGVHLHLGGDLISSTIAFNKALGGGGGGVHNFGQGGAIRVKNTIIALNSSTMLGRDVLGLFDSLGHNLIGDPTSGAANTDFTDPLNKDVLGVDPKLGALASNGGPTQTHALLAGSPAIDRGDNAGAPGIDQRGVARPRDGNANGLATVDIGAFER